MGSLTITIVGCGLIGTSIALAARRRWPEARIVGVDRPEQLLHPTVASVYDLASPDLRLVAEADAVVLAAPVDAILALIPEVQRVVRADALVTDVGSTKRAIVAAARGAGLAGFVGGHPMAGAETSGPRAARADLFDGRPWYLVTPEGPAGRSRAHALVEGLGGLPVWTDADTHDRILAAVSHLPQVVASALMVAAGNAATHEGLRWAGAGLRDSTRLAAGSAPLWESVLATNQDHLRPLLLQLSDELRGLAGRLSEPTAVRRLFDAANLHRRELERGLDEDHTKGAKATKNAH